MQRLGPRWRCGVVRRRPSTRNTLLTGPPGAAPGSPPRPTPRPPARTRTGHAYRPIGRNLQTLARVVPATRPPVRFGRAEPRGQQPVQARSLADDVPRLVPPVRLRDANSRALARARRKTMLTGRRSPTIVADADADAAAAERDPQPPQKASVGEMSAPQAAHLARSAAPHCRQYSAAAPTLAPHVMQVVSAEKEACSPWGSVDAGRRALAGSPAISGVRRTLPMRLTGRPTAGIPAGRRARRSASRSSVPSCNASARRSTVSR
jgi:hypothetical protein